MGIVVHRPHAFTMIGVAWRVCAGVLGLHTYIAVAGQLSPRAETELSN